MVKWQGRNGNGQCGVFRIEQVECAGNGDRYLGALAKARG
jgi:hypothetical protein